MAVVTEALAKNRRIACAAKVKLITPARRLPLGKHAITPARSAMNPATALRDRPNEISLPDRTQLRKSDRSSLPPSCRAKTFKFPAPPTKG